MLAERKTNRALSGSQEAEEEVAEDTREGRENAGHCGDWEWAGAEHFVN